MPFIYGYISVYNYYFPKRDSETKIRSDDKLCATSAVDLAAQDRRSWAETIQRIQWNCKPEAMPIPGLYLRCVASWIPMSNK